MPFLVLCLRDITFLSVLIFCSWPPVFRLGFLQSQIRDIRSKKKTWGTHPCVFPGVPSSLIGLFSSLQLSEFLGLFCMSFPELLTVPRGRKEESSTSSQKKESVYRDLEYLSLSSAFLWELFIGPSLATGMIPNQFNASSPWQPLGFGVSGISSGQKLRCCVNYSELISVPKLADPVLCRSPDVCLWVWRGRTQIRSLFSVLLHSYSSTICPCLPSDLISFNPWIRPTPFQQHWP